VGDQPQTPIVVPVVRIVVVPVSAAGVVLIVVPRAAPQHPVSSACARNPTAEPLLLPNSLGEIWDKLLLGSTPQGFEPTSQQSPDFIDHPAHVVVLARIE
jgi:hypothetical protein